MLRWKGVMAGTSWRSWPRSSALVLAISLLLLASPSASGVLQNEWHIQISLPRTTYYVGETINLTGTISPPLSATLLLTFILPDGSFNTFYVNSDDAGDFSFGRQYGTGSYSVYGNIVSPQLNGNVTTDLVNFIIISKVQPPPNSTTSTSQSTTVPPTTVTTITSTTSTSTTTTSTTQGENDSSQPSKTFWTLNRTLGVLAVVIIVFAALLVFKLRRRA